MERWSSDHRNAEAESVQLFSSTCQAHPEEKTHSRSARSRWDCCFQQLYKLSNLVHVIIVVWNNFWNGLYNHLWGNQCVHINFFYILSHWALNYWASSVTGGQKDNCLKADKSCFKHSVYKFIRQPHSVRFMLQLPLINSIGNYQNSISFRNG